MLAWSTGISLTLMNAIIPGLAATDVALVSGGFRRSIPVKEIKHFAKTGEAAGLLGSILMFSKQDSKEVAKLLNRRLNVPLILTSRLINTQIGEAIVRRVARVIYPLYTPKADIVIPAIRAGIINGLQSDEGLTAVSFLTAYPNQVMAINISALFAMIETMESVAGLVRSFADSPLDGLKNKNR
ncbi:alpha/beta hydrolase [Synechococcus sp. M16CYN]|uniref:alpha/beta hydrolase n=1 Tax=Synechococcus sp. M16CYN TaxID=3103139 RepID=UPI0030E08472